MRDLKKLIKLLFYVENIFKITGRGNVAAGKILWYSDDKVKVGAQCLLLGINGKAPIPFKMVGYEMGSADRLLGGILLPPGLEVPEYSYIAILED